MVKAKTPSGDAATPETMAQVTPRLSRSYDDMNTGHMVFELQGTVGEIRQAVSHLQKTADESFDHLEKRIDGHATALDAIRRMIWMVTGGAVVVGTLVGLATAIGLTKIGEFLVGR